MRDTVLTAFIEEYLWAGGGNTDADVCDMLADDNETIYGWMVADEWIDSPFSPIHHNYTYSDVSEALDYIREGLLT